MLARKSLAPNIWSQRRDWAVGWAAIAAAMVLGVVIGQFVRVNDRAHAPYSISPDEAHLLDTMPSGRVRETLDGAFEVTLSLRSEAGDLCRQFRLTRGAQNTDVIACRRGDSGWRMEAAVATDRMDGSYTPAGSNAALDAVIVSLGPVEAVDQAQEQALIGRRWR